MRVGVLLESTGRRVDVASRVGRHGAGVDDRRAGEPSAANGFEDVDRPEDVDRGTERRVGAAERDLERREMDDVRDPVLVEGAFDSREIGDIALDQREPLQFVWLEDLAEPARVLSKVEADYRRPLAEQLADRPRSDAAQGPGDEETVRSVMPLSDTRRQRAPIQRIGALLPGEPFRRPGRRRR